MDSIMFRLCARRNAVALIGLFFVTQTAVAVPRWHAGVDNDARMLSPPLAIPGLSLHKAIAQAYPFLPAHAPESRGLTDDGGPGTRAAYSLLRKLEEIRIVVPPVRLSDLTGGGDIVYIQSVAERLRRLYPGKRVSVLLLDFEFYHAYAHKFQARDIQRHIAALGRLPQPDRALRRGEAFSARVFSFEKNSESDRRGLQLGASAFEHGGIRYEYVPMDKEKNAPLQLQEAFAARQKQEPGAVIHIFMPPIVSFKDATVWGVRDFFAAQGPVLSLYEFGEEGRRRQEAAEGTAAVFGFGHGAIGMIPVSSDARNGGDDWQRSVSDRAERTRLRRELLAELLPHLAQTQRQRLADARWGYVSTHGFMRGLGAIDALERAIDRASELAREDYVFFVLESRGEEVKKYYKTRRIMLRKGLYNFYEAVSGSDRYQPHDSVLSDSSIHVIAVERLPPPMFRRLRLLSADLFVQARGPNLFAEMMQDAVLTGVPWVVEFQRWQHSARDAFIAFLASAESLRERGRMRRKMIDYYAHHDDGFLEDLFTRRDDYTRMFGALSRELDVRFIVPFDDKIQRSILRALAAFSENQNAASSVYLTLMPRNADYGSAEYFLEQSI